MHRPHVVIIGAGFGGLTCARALAEEPVRVTVIDRQNYHLFQPLLYQVASALLNPADIAFPLRAVFSSTPNVDFLHGDVDRVAYADKEVVLRDGARIRYDHVVVAAGAETNFFGNTSIASHALGLKNLAEAMQLRNHILLCLEAASRQDDDALRRALLTFVIVGAGPTGVEYAGALAELMRLVLGREYKSLPTDAARILLVEGVDRVLPPFHPRLSAYTKKRLERLGVEVVCSTLVASASHEHVELSNGERIPCRTLVWSAGVKPETLARQPGVPTTRSGRIEVDEHCRIVGAEGAFAIGDLAAARHDDKELPMVSPPAMQAARHVARFIVDTTLNRDPEAPGPFVYWDKGMMAIIGRGHAVAQLGRMRMTGYLGWLAWLLVHIYYLIGVRNRIAVMWHWMWNYVRRDRPLRIITRADAPHELSTELPNEQRPALPTTKS